MRYKPENFIFAHPPYANIIKYSKDIKENLSRLELKTLDSKAREILSFTTLGDIFILKHL